MEYEQEQELEQEMRPYDKYDCPDCGVYYEAIDHFNRELKELRNQEPQQKNHERMAEIEKSLKSLNQAHNNHQHKTR